MAEIAQGNRRAFRMLVERHVARAQGLAYRVLGSRSDAEEMAQEAFLRVWTVAPRWRLDGGASFRTWFSRVVMNLCIDRKRRHRTEPLEAAGDPADPSPAADRLAGENEEAAVVAAAMAELPERQRIALSLCYWQGLSNVEAAETMGLSVGAIESLLVRARRTLKDKLGPVLGPGETGGGKLGAER